MSHTYDVVVVGARVAGASTALLLARAGLDVALVDRGAYGSDTLSTHALMRGGVLQLSRWGVLDDVVASGAPAVERTVFHYADGDMVPVTIRPSLGVPALYAPRRDVLDRILVDAAAAAGAEVIHGPRVTDVLRDGRGRAAGVRAVHTDGTSLELPARFVVGADGLRSTVAEQVGAREEVASTSKGAVLFRYYADLCVAGYEWAYGPSSAAGLIPTNDGMTCVFVSTSPERMRRARRSGAGPAFEQVFAAAAPDHLPRLHIASPVGRFHGWSGVSGFVRRSWGPGWALVGDAGYFKDPITAHGMTDALRDAELLSRAIVAAWSGERTEQEALGGYQHERDRLSHRLVQVTEQVATYDWDMLTIRRLLREVSSAMVDEVEALEQLALRDGWPGNARNISPDKVGAAE